MARSVSTPPPTRATRGGTSFASVVTLASWRLRRTWFLLLMTMLGMIAAVIITCSVPLFLNVMTTASLRDTLREQPDSSEIALSANPLGLSSHLVHDVQKQADPLFQRNLGNFLKDPTQLTINSDNFDFISPSVQGPHALHMLSASMQNSASHLKLEQGRLPHITGTPSNEVEIMLTPETAQSLNIHLGSVVQLGSSFYLQLPDPFAPTPPPIMGFPIKAHVVGIFTVDGTNISYWHGVDFNPYEVHVTSPLKSGNYTVLNYSILLPVEGFLGIYDSLSAKYHVDTPLVVSGTTLSLYYHLNPLNISVSQTDDLIKRMANLQSAISTQYAEAQGYFGLPYDPSNPPAYPYIVQITVNSPLLSLPGTPSSLEQFRGRASVANIPVSVIFLQILALILFFMSLMTDLLVDRQSDAIAILRSRGASQGQIFGALLTQSVGLGLIAIAIGIPLAGLVVYFVALGILPAHVQDALNVLTSHPVLTMLTTIGYAVAVMLIVLLTMSLSLARAARMDVLAVRREASRANRRPLWQRLNLDVVAGVIALGGYAISLYLTTIGTLLSGSAQALIVTPLSLIAPFFLVLGCLLLFLRFFPFFLHLGARAAVRGRSAASMLALAQMSRAPRQALRMTLLLALATAFALFSLVFTASQEQRIEDLSAYQVGADFSGNIPDHTYQQSLLDWTVQYKAIPGVQSVSVGYANTGTVGGGSLPLTVEIRGVDIGTFGKTAIWPSGSSSQSLSSLLALLNAKRQYGIANNVVPVIVDETIRSKLSLHIGSAFLVNVDGNAQLISDLHCVVVGTVEHIPTTNTNAQVNGTASGTSSGGILLDYQTYNQVYAQQIQNLLGKGKGGVPINYVWLRTKGDTASLIRIRTALNSVNFSLVNLQDRRAIVDRLHTDPLIISLISILSVGTIATLLLAVLGDLLASWLSARTRLTNFAVLRALGTSPRQVASVLTWEQGLVYLVGVLLGIIFGIVLSTTIVPTLIANNTSGIGGLPAQIVVPLTLIVAFIAVAVVFVVALGMMVRIVSKPSMSQTLRLNED